MGAQARLDGPRRAWRLEPGAELGSWRIGEPLGAGGMGEVYEAQHSYLPTRRAAVKVMRVQRGADPSFAARFRAEAGLLASLDHPNVVRLYDASVTDEGLAWMAMELLDGQTLEQVIGPRCALSLADSLQILGEVADGVHAAHLLGVVHRDLKPSNVFVTARHTVKVLDFGTSKLLDSQNPLRGIKPTTAQNVVLGTIAFMSPEQILGEPPLDHRSDIFCLGIIAYLMLGSKHPFAGQDAASPDVLGYRALIMDPAPLPELVASCPPELGALVHSMLAKNRESRPRTMAQVAEQLRALRGRHLVGEGLPSAPLTSLGRTAAVDRSGEVTRSPLLGDPGEPPATPPTEARAPAGHTDLSTLDSTVPIGAVPTVDPDAPAHSSPRPDEPISNAPIAPRPAPADGPTSQPGDRHGASSPRPAPTVGPASPPGDGHGASLFERIGGTLRVRPHELVIGVMGGLAIFIAFVAWQQCGSVADGGDRDAAQQAPARSGQPVGEGDDPSRLPAGPTSADRVPGEVADSPADGLPLSDATASARSASVGTRATTVDPTAERSPPRAARPDSDQPTAATARRAPPPATSPSPPSGPAPMFE